MRPSQSISPRGFVRNAVAKAYPIYYSELA